MDFVGGWACSFTFAWAKVLTYERAVPQPDRFVTESGQTLMTAETIVAGKAAFKRADLSKSQTVQLNIDRSCLTSRTTTRGRSGSPRSNFGALRAAHEPACVNNERLTERFRERPFETHTGQLCCAAIRVRKRLPTEIAATQLSLNRSNRSECP
jgi:nitric oxide reductase large subunit